MEGIGEGIGGVTLSEKRDIEEEGAIAVLLQPSKCNELALNSQSVGLLATGYGDGIYPR